ncbi:MAG: alpha/beta hydrolase [Betaproteobacteria bacterium]|nr:alpha/beta hydrolase [Betaproteobacteria bacterium]
MLRSFLFWSIAALLVALVALATLFFLDMRAAYQRIQGRSTVLASPWGDIEYVRGGAGAPVLVIHGSGGGFDQGELLAHAVLGEGYSWIAPSRFGYLRSTFLPAATFDQQAHAYAYLLDQLGIEKVAVVALSHGGPSALLFALLHPERVKSLTLLSCGVAASAVPNQAQANAQGDALMKIYRYDFLYWAITRFLRPWFVKLMGADGAVLDQLGAEERALVDDLIVGMNPSSARAAGAAFDNQAAMPNARIAGIRAPTLVVHAADDSLQLFDNAQFALTHLPNARLLRFEHGGHLVLAVERQAIRAAVAAQLRQNR